MATAALKNVPYCQYCKEELSEIWTKCAVCPNFELCAQCFFSGIEVKPHSEEHDYDIVGLRHEVTLPPLIPGELNWKGEDEVELLDSMIALGYGNWEAVSAWMKQKKTCQEIKDHYNEVFVDGNIGRATFGMVSPAEIEDCTDPIDRSVPVVLDIDKELCETLGYQPLRDEFQEEYDDDAEKILLFDPLDNDDPELQTPLNLACIDIYRRRQRKRHKVKELVKDYNLFKEFDNAEKARRSEYTMDNSDSKESFLRNQLKVFSRLVPASEHETLIQNMLEEKRLKSRIEELIAKLPQNNMESSCESLNVEDGVENIDQLDLSKENKHKKSFPTEANAFLPSPKKESDKFKSAPQIATLRAAKNFPKRVSKERLASIQSYNLLTKAERRLCLDLDLEPTCYMALKLVLLKETNMHSGSDVREFPPEGMSETDLQQVTSYLSSNGWIAAS